MLDSHRRARRLALVGLVAAATSGLAAAEPTTIPDSELKARRAAVLSRMPRQLLVVLARPALADVAGQGFLQDPDFLYLTGLRQAVGAVLVLDGPAAESRLYQPTSLGPFADHVGLKVDGAAETSGLDDFATWDQLVPYQRRRVGEAKVADIRLARAGMLEAIVATIGTPPGLTPGAGARAHLKRALAEAIPGTPIEDDVLLSEMRLVKSPAEIDLLRRAGAASAAALLAGMGSIGPGHRQREAEAARTCSSSPPPATSF